MTKPFQLDPFTRFTNVGWNVGTILVLEWHYGENHQRPVFTLHGLPFGSSMNLFNTIYEKADPSSISPPVVNPISTNMRKFLRMWNKPSHQVVFPTPVFFETGAFYNQFIGNALLFFNLPKIRSLLPNDNFSFKVASSAGGSPRSYTFTTYWLWGDDFGATTLEENEAHPFTTGDPFNAPFGVIALPQPFDTAAERDAYLAFGTPPWHGTDRVGTTEVPDALAWNFRASTYRKKLNFPSTAQANASWNVDADSVTKVTGSAGPLVGLPAFEVTISVNTKTLALTTSKV